MDGRTEGVSNSPLRYMNKTSQDLLGLSDEVHQFFGNPHSRPQGDLGSSALHKQCFGLLCGSREKRGQKDGEDVPSVHGFPR